MRNYNNTMLLNATRESNRIEGELTTGKSFNRHWRATQLCRTAAEEGQLLHPRVLYQVLVEGLSLPPGHHPGNYRTLNVYVDQNDGHILVFPPHQEVLALMAAWWEECEKALCSFPGNDIYSSASVRWNFHAWFEAIHPFPDFNGRTGRLLWWSMAMLADVPIEVITFEERFTYYDRLEEWRKANCNKPLMNPFRLSDGQTRVRGQEHAGQTRYRAPSGLCRDQGRGH